MGRFATFNGSVEKFAARWNQFKPKSDVLDADRAKVLQAIEFVKEKRQEFAELKETKEKLCTDCENFNLATPNFPQFDQIEADLQDYQNNWLLYEEFNSALEEFSKEEWITFRFSIFQTFI